MSYTGQVILDWKTLRFPGRDSSGKSRDDFRRFVKCLVLSSLLEKEEHETEKGPTPEELIAITAAVHSMGVDEKRSRFVVRSSERISYWKIASRLQI
jgi:hypothetical protein